MTAQRQHALLRYGCWNLPIWLRSATVFWKILYTIWSHYQRQQPRYNARAELRVDGDCDQAQLVVLAVDRSLSFWFEIREWISANCKYVSTNGIN